MITRGELLPYMAVVQAVAVADVGSTKASKAKHNKGKHGKGSQEGLLSLSSLPLHVLSYTPLSPGGRGGRCCLRGGEQRREEEDRQTRDRQTDRQTDR